KKFKIWLISILSIVMIGGAGFFLYLIQGMPSLRTLERIDPAMATQIYSVDGEVLHSFFRWNRTFTPYDKIPKTVIDALLSTEDREFYHHWGIDLAGIGRAAVKNILTFDLTGQGASTITMQLARNLYLGFEQTYTRKIREILTSIQIERTYAKNEIIEIYLNYLPFGNNAYGIRSGARRYFDKPDEDLEVQEAAMLIGLLKGQTEYSPVRHPDRALKRRNIVMKMMVDNNCLDQAVYDSLRVLPLNLNLNDPHDMKTAPYFTEYIRRQLNDLQDSLHVNIYEDGLRVYTTLNTKIQKYMEMAVDSTVDGIQSLVRNQPAFKKLRATMTDTAFQELSTMQLAFVAIDPKTGHILAMIGGRDFNKSKFNRVTQMRRQPGSAFKPFLYTAAIDNGYLPTDQYLNQPTVEVNEDGTRWTPKNYEGTVGGLMTLREALRGSKNLVAIRLISDITPKTVVRYAKAMGITTPLRPYTTLALGTSEVIPLELVSAFGVFANNGVHVKPISILKIEDKNGNMIYQARTERREVLSEQTTYIMNNMLQDVMNRGTGYGVRRDYKFFQPAGGKTGTTNDNTNAWFVGFTPDIVTGVWVGLDDFQYNLGPRMAGSRAALPFWGKFMKTVYDSLKFRHSSFTEASGIVRIKICNDTKKIATKYCPDTYEEIFNINYKPSETCTTNH
ncbi:MAG: PBP1A family penicillin-binding protein, partial [Calditrichaceae bacterium]